MILVDLDIKERIDSNALIENFDIKNIGSVSYDLRIKDFVIQNENGENIKKKSFNLKPSESIIVSTVETLNMPDDLIGRIVDKNSQIRRGIQIAAPVYQPGHKTRVFIRVTNISGGIIELNSEEQIAAIMFEQLSQKPQNTYEGTFVDEYEYTGLAAYKNVFSNSIKEIDKKIEDVKSLENKIYGNVMTLMSIFIAIFSLIDINLDMITKLEFTRQSIFAYDIMIVGILGLFIALISVFLPNRHSLKNKILCFVFPSVLLVITGFII